MTGKNNRINETGEVLMRFFSQTQAILNLTIMTLGIVSGAMSTDFRNLSFVMPGR